MIMKFFGKYGLVIILMTLVIISCKEEVKPKNGARKISLKLVGPDHDSQYTIGEAVNVNIQVLHPEDVVDLTLMVNDTIYQENIKPETQTIKIPTENAKVGFTTIFLSYKNKDGKSKGATRNIVLFSDLVPEQKIADIVETYPHKTNAYTQGLEFYDSRLFESTGSGGVSKSFIAEVDLTTGQQERSVELDPQYFGEGISILNDTIYQLTWQKQKCFLYNMNLEKIGEFDYEGEGWGLCNNGKSLIMTNGTSKIVWRNPQTFEVEKAIYAFNDQSDVPALNEVELIDGKLVSNVYRSNYLVEIDTTTGKVIAQIDCSGIVNAGQTESSDVLNGIAYNPANQKIYLTGKLWPSLFEVKFE